MTAPTIDHIGIIVDALEPAILAWSRILPGAAITRRSLPELGLEVAEFTAANVSIELLQYSTTQGSFARQVMGDELGVNHVSIAVADLDAAIDGLATAGVKPMPGFPRRGAHGQIAFMRCDPRLQVLVELCQPDPATHALEKSHA
jgi:methylmalonyl-CoA/ethylmalonyl-CoA epimerase